MPNNSALVSQSFPASVAPGEAFTATVTYRNTGDTTWTQAAPTPHRLGSSNPRDNYVWTAGFNRFELPAGDVPPGGEAAFTLTLTAPASPGTYSCGWEMVQDFVQWFGPASGQSVAVVGSPPTVPPPPPPPPGGESMVPLPAPRPDLLDLVSACVIDTQPYPMGSGQHRVRWTNRTQRDLLVKKVYLWTGVDQNGRCDVHAELFRVADGSPLAVLQWDHYAEPTAEQGRQFDFDPYFRLAAGEAVELLYYANPLAGNGGTYAHHRVTLWALFA